MGDIRHLWTFTYHQYYIARAVFLLRFSVANRRMRLSFFFCALYTPHHICKSFPTYYDHVNCPLLSVESWCTNYAYVQCGTTCTAYGLTVLQLYCCAAVLLYRSESVSYIISREGTSRVHTRLLVRANDAPHHTAAVNLCQQEAYYSCMPIRTQVNVM